jgi:hypothetical protein
VQISTIDRIYLISFGVGLMSPPPSDLNCDLGLMPTRDVDGLEPGMGPEAHLMFIAERWLTRDLYG